MPVPAPSQAPTGRDGAPDQVAARRGARLLRSPAALPIAVAVLALVEQARVFWLFGRRYATEDAALLWYAGRELAHGRVHQPSFYGQSYGTVVEAIPAVLVRLLTPFDRPSSQALATALLFAATWLLVAWTAWRHGRPALAATAAAAPLVLSVEYAVVAAAPRGFAVAIVLAVGAAAALAGGTGPETGPRRLVAFAALGSLAAAWDTSSLFVVAPLGVYALLSCRRSTRRLLALVAGGVPGAAWAGLTAWYYGRHPDENLYAQGGFGVDLQVLRHNLPHLGRFLTFYRPEVLRHEAIPVAALVVLVAVLVRQAIAPAPGRARLPVAGATLAFVLLLLAAVATPKSLNSNEQAFLAPSRFFLPVPVAAVLLLVVCVPRRDRSEGPPRAVPLPGRGTAAVLALAAVSFAVVLPRLPDRVDALVTQSRTAKEGVDVRAVDEVEARCRTLERIARSAGTDLVVFRSDLVATYACPATTDGAIETLHPGFDRRVWRLREELARDRTALVVADVPAGWCDGVARSVARCDEQAAAPLDAAVLRFSKRGTLLLLKQVGVPIQPFHGDPARLAPLLCQTPFPPEGGAPPAPDPGADRSLAADLTVDLASKVSNGRDPLRADVTIINTGTLEWPAENQPVGRVRLGIHLLDEQGRVVRLDYVHLPLPRPRFRKTQPGETLRSTIAVPAPPAGRYIFEFDLVSEGVAWFASKGSATVRIPVVSRCDTTAE